MAGKGRAFAAFAQVGVINVLVLNTFLGCFRDLYQLILCSRSVSILCDARHDIGPEVLYCALCPDVTHSAHLWITRFYLKIAHLS